MAEIHYPRTPYEEMPQDWSDSTPYTNKVTKATPEQLRMARLAEFYVAVDNGDEAAERQLAEELLAQSAQDYN